MFLKNVDNALNYHKISHDKVAIAPKHLADLTDKAVSVPNHLAVFVGKVGIVP